MEEKTTEWEHEKYETDFSADEYILAKKQIREQNEFRDKVILLSVSYNIMSGKAIIEKKTRIAPLPDKGE